MPSKAGKGIYRWGG